MTAIHDLREKRQLNVQEQCSLAKTDILDCALAFLRGEAYLRWVPGALRHGGLDERGILAQVSIVPCGGGEQCARAVWVSSAGKFYDVEATVTLDHSLVGVDSFHEVTSTTSVSSHVRGIGKSFGQLALEVLSDLAGS